MNKRLSELNAHSQDLDEGIKQTLFSLVLEAKSIESLKEMKETTGWKILHQKLREELHKRILEKVKDDEIIRILLQILSTVETEQQEKMLDEAIDQVIPN